MQYKWPKFVQYITPNIPPIINPSLFITPVIVSSKKELILIAHRENSYFAVGCYTCKSLPH